jgi:hypothetical protein
MHIKTKSIIALILFCVVDTFIPVPILGIILIYAALRRPPWFKDLVIEMYGSD